MRWSRAGRCIAALGFFASFAPQGSHSATPISVRKDGSLAVAGRSVRCGNTRAVLDSRLPNLGLAAPGVVVVNPRLLQRHSETVRLFVFHHECGHHHVGGSETGADCWAVKQGVRQGWLSRKNLTQVCRSFGNGPATSTHPSGSSRCASLEQCFANATAAQARRAKSQVAETAPDAEEAPDQKAFSGPVRERKRRSRE